MLFEAAFNRGGVQSTYWDLTFPLLFSDPLSGLAIACPTGACKAATTAGICAAFTSLRNAVRADWCPVPTAFTQPTPTCL